MSIAVDVVTKVLGQSWCSRFGEIKIGWDYDSQKERGEEEKVLEGLKKEASKVRMITR